MNPGLLVKLRPSSPWRIGPPGGAKDRVDLILHSDTLYSSLTHAMRWLGELDAWLDATARGTTTPQVAVSSLFPFSGEVRYFVPPRTIWPPAPSLKVRWKGARFVPHGVIEAVLLGRALNEDRWSVDGESECLVAGGRTAPFRISLRSRAAVDRLSGVPDPHSVACLEFTPGSGLWTAVVFADRAARERWMEPVKAAFRWLADSGFGGERSSGWGRSEAPEFREGTLPGLVFSVPGSALDPAEPKQFWMLSLFAPAEADSVDWTRGNYTVSARSGRISSDAGSGAEKKRLHLVEEGAVLVAGDAPKGRAIDVAPDGFAHPVYKAGFGVSIQIPTIRAKAEVIESAPETEGAPEGSALQSEASIETPAAEPEPAPAEEPAAEAATEPAPAGELASGPELAAPAAETEALNVTDPEHEEPALPPASEIEPPAAPGEQAPAEEPPSGIDDDPDEEPVEKEPEDPEKPVPGPNPDEGTEP